MARREVQQAHGEARRVRAAHRRRTGHPLHPPVVHRRAGVPEVVRHHPGRTGDRLRGGHGLRRVLHRGLLPGAGVRHAGPARPDHVPDPPLEGLGERGPHVLQHRDARRRAFRGRPSLRAAAQPAARRRPGLHLLRRARTGVLLLRRLGRGAAGPRPRRLLRPHPPRRGQRVPAPHHHRPRGPGHLGGVVAPRGLPQPARAGPAAHRRPDHGRQPDDRPPGGQGGGAGARHLRHLHAQAHRGRRRQRPPPAPVAVRGRPQRLLRPGLPPGPVAGGPGLHRRPAAPRRPDHRHHQPVGQLLQAPGGRFRRPGARRLGAQQPVGAGAGPLGQAGQAR